jgi:acyl carrier protein
MGKYTKECILNELIKILEDMSSDWDLEYADGINGDTKLVADLLFESIDIVQLLVAVEQHFNVKNLPSEKLLMRDGAYVSDLTASEIASFLSEEMK